MDDLRLEATKSSPFISFDTQRGVLEIKGKSYPENAAKFYAPVFEWVSAYLNSDDDRIVEVNLELIYLNSSSSKAILNLFDILDRCSKSGRAIVINWRYHEENETALECGEEFGEDLEAVTFNLVKIEVT